MKFSELQHSTQPHNWENNCKRVVFPYFLITTLDCFKHSCAPSSPQGLPRYAIILAQKEGNSEFNIAPTF